MNSVLYNLIPNELMSGTILDLGCGDLDSQLNSRHNERFIRASEESRYLGVDVILVKESLLYTERTDILSFEGRPEHADLVLLIEVAEHVDYSKWISLFDCALSCVKLEGSLIVSTPYMEPVDGGMTSKDDVCPHIVFGIDSNLLSKFLPKGTSYRYIGDGTKRVKVGRFPIPYVKVHKPIWIVGVYRKEREQ